MNYPSIVNSPQIVDSAKNDSTRKINLVVFGEVRHNGTYRNPSVLHNLIDGQAIRRINTQHSFDQFFRTVADILPFGIREIVLASPDALLHARRYGKSVITVKWWKTTQSEGVETKREKKTQFKVKRND